MADTNDRAGVSRRGFMLAGAALGSTAIPGVAFAQNAMNELLNAPTRGNWDDQFDTRGTSAREVATNAPIYSPNTLSAMQQAIDAHMRIAQAGGWPRVPQTNTLRLGVEAEAVDALRQRLAVSGDLSPQAGRSYAFDTYVDAAVKRFQARHGLPADGVVGQGTFEAMNVPAELRMQQLRVNYDRVAPNASAAGNGNRYIMVNIPAAAIEAVEGGRVAQRHAAVVGKIDRQTPILSSRVSDLNLNPYWHAPASIVRKDIIPQMRKDPQYLTNNSIRIYDGNGNEIPPQSIDWSTDEAVGYLLRQDPGANNAMASVKINFPNQHAVYLHDTPQQGLFSQLLRFESSGCVRVQNVRDLIVWIARNAQGWDRQRIAQVVASRERVDVPITETIPIYLDYVTAWATDPNIVQFRDDIYHRDGLERVAMSELTAQPYQAGQQNPYAQGDDQVAGTGAF